MLPFLRLRRLMPAFALFVLSGQQALAQSPELLQLMGEIKAEIKGGTRGMERGPVCTPQMFDMAVQGIQANEFTQLMNRVVVGPLETGAKIAAGALGVPGGLVTTYSLVRCYMQEADWEGLKRCAAGEAIGYAIGKGLDKADIDGLENALAGAAWDKAFGALRDAVESYQATSEPINWTAGGTCKITVTANWNKRRAPGAEGGYITGQINARECVCRAPSDLEYGYMHFRVPVRYTRAGSDQPGWAADTKGETRVRVKCCNMGGEGPVTRYRLDGGFSEFVRDQADPPVTPPETPKPPPPPPPAPAEPQWSEANPCPECMPFLELAEKHRLAALDFEAQVRQIRERQGLNRERQRATQQRIDQIDKELSGREGEGGSATDPDSGLTTESITQKDGSVRITVRDRNGKLLSEHTRQRRDLAKLRQQRESEQAELARLKAEEGKLAGELDYASKALDTQRKLEADARTELQRCVEEKCRKRVAGQPPQTACAFPAAQPVTIGPREKFGYGESQKGAEIGRAALSILGGFLGGRGGGGGPGFGSPIETGPNLVDDPVRTKQTFTDAASGTVIKVGGQYRPDGKLVVSVDVDSAQDKGVVHQVAMERLQQQPDGACNRQVAEPLEWLHYSIWEDWWAKIRIQRYESVDGGPWRRTHDSGWQDWGSGSRLLGTGVLSADQIPGTAWGSMGADRAFGGPRAAGAVFDPGKPQIVGKPAGNERLVVHVTQPGKDPVTTVPFTLYPTYGADGRVSYADKAPAAAAAR